MCNKGSSFLSQKGGECTDSLAGSNVWRKIQGLAPQGTGDILPPPHRFLLTVHPQAELATSHKCLSHEVKRLTEENQGLRAEQLPSPAPWVLEQEESLPSSITVRGAWALRAWGPPWRLFSTHSTALAWDHGTGTDPGCHMLAVSSPWPTHLAFLRLSFLI